MAQPSPRPPLRHHLAAGYLAQTGPGFRTASTPRKHSGERRWPAMSSRHTVSSYWKSSSASAGSLPARKVYILAPRCVASHRSKRPRRPTGHRRSPLAPRRTSPSCLSPPAVKFQISEAKHRAGSRYRNIWSLARLRPPGSQSTEPKAIPALARFGMSKMRQREHFPLYILHLHIAN